MSDSIVTGRQPPNLELDIILKCMVWQKKRRNTAKSTEFVEYIDVTRSPPRSEFGAMSRPPRNMWLDQLCRANGDEPSHINTWTRRTREWRYGPRTRWLRANDGDDDDDLYRANRTLLSPVHTADYSRRIWRQSPNSETGDYSLNINILLASGPKMSLPF